MSGFDRGAICDAIKGRRVVEFTYKMERRLVEPHLLGYDRDGDLTLSAWQTSGTRPGWRDFHLAKLTGLTTTGQSFSGARPGYNPHDTTLQQVVCRV